jgi:hypothetical protein
MGWFVIAEKGALEQPAVNSLSYVMRQTLAKRSGWEENVVGRRWTRPEMSHF